jgi:hypothetical protein
VWYTLVIGIGKNKGKIKGGMMKGDCDGNGLRE